MSSLDTKYEYWCSDEKTWLSEWSSTAPTVCKNNAAHTISLVQVCQELEPNGRSVIISEQKKEINGSSDFFVQTIRIDGPANTSTATNFSWPMPIYIYEINIFANSANMDGDKVDTIINPEYTCGTVTSSVSAGATTLVVAETVLKYARKPGWYVVTITDGTNTESLGRIIAINRTTSTLTVETATVNAFASGSVIKVSYYIMKDFELFTTNVPIRAGASKLGGSYIPANVPVRVIYHNNNNVPKGLVVQLEYCW